MTVTARAEKMRMIKEAALRRKEEQEREFLADWERRNGMVEGRADKPTPPRNGRGRFLPIQDGSQGGKVLAAAKTLGRPFTLPELVLAAWGSDRAMFGLSGFEMVHPSDRRVYMTLVGKRGLIARGLIRNLGGGKYEAT